MEDKAFSHKDLSVYRSKMCKTLLKPARCQIWTSCWGPDGETFKWEVDSAEFCKCTVAKSRDICGGEEFSVWVFWRSRWLSRGQRLWCFCKTWRGSDWGRLRDALVKTGEDGENTLRAKGLHAGWTPGGMGHLWYQSSGTDKTTGRKLSVCETKCVTRHGGRQTEEWTIILQPCLYSQI